MTEGFVSFTPGRNRQLSIEHSRRLRMHGQRDIAKGFPQDLPDLNRFRSWTFIPDSNAEQSGNRPSRDLDLLHTIDPMR
jgi:hypothetical protein